MWQTKKPDPCFQFGKNGGLMELLYAATGFLLVQRQVYLDVPKYFGRERKAQHLAQRRKDRTKNYSRD